MIENLNTTLYKARYYALDGENKGNCVYEAYSTNGLEFIDAYRALYAMGIRVPYLPIIWESTDGENWHRLPGF